MGNQGLHVERCGHGPDLVLLHGWGLHGGVWQDLAEALAPRFRLHVPDLPGHGASASITPYDLDALAAALAQVLPAGAHVCGWSLGGQVALRLAQHWPGHVARLTLIATTPCFRRRPDWPHGMDEASLAEFARNLEADYEGTLKRFLALTARAGEGARGVIARLRASLFTRGRPVPEALRAGLAILREADMRGELAQVMQPALVIHGSHDNVTPPAAGRWLAQHLPDGRLLEVAGAAHAPFLSHRAQVAQAVEAFSHG
ncbi:pimeloyl-ACP methyl ester esterase BioH [Thiobacter aerophilum]|uniref:Pimeloyl-[acyl-carrier protein] methyl ester esterase n=1 Tax=Thiobacter aerophilum TaxID=3121275 RepID=A0ABV0EEB5_9BURK